MQQLYEVVVRNELTNEETTVSLPSASQQDAQVEALICLFRCHGWRKSCTLRVSLVSEAALAALSA
ncbi:MAG: hypothetical protein NVS2B16_18840 [Chloroflexota bacterium]